MSSCQVCDQELGAVRCNGHCQRRVHPRCAKTVGVMLAANDSGDLYWFCEGCRRGLSAVPKDSAGVSGPLTLGNLKRRMATMDGSSEKIARSLGKGAASVPNSDLPVEIWTEIFKEMSVNQMLNLRLVCRRWKGVVDECSALKKKFTATFLGLVIDGDYKPENLLPVSKVNFQEVEIRTVEPWWKSFGFGLAELQIGLHCSINYPILMDLLKHLPNLEKLKLVDLTKCCATSDENLDEVSNFQLIKVKELTITSIGDESFYKDILKLCCNLKALSLDFKHSAPLGTARTVASLHKTLEELHINPTEEFLVELMKLDRLKLKKLTLAGDKIKNTHILIDFCKMQPNLEYLNVQDSLSLDDAGLAGIVKRVPKLKSLSMCLGYETKIELKFLSRLTQLQSLNLSGIYDEYLCFYKPCRLPGLRQLQLRHFIFCDNVLHQWLENVPNLRSITIEKCEFGCWSDLLEALETPKLLEHATIKITDELNEMAYYHYNELTALKSLQLEGCVMSPNMLNRLLGLCPGLREFRAENMNFNKAALGVVCRQLRRLNQLIFVRCKLPGNAESSVRIHCRELQELKICGE